MKNTIKRLFLLLLTLPLCGCYPTGLRQNNDVPQRVEGFDTDNIVVYETDVKTASVYNAKIHNFAHDELADYFKKMGIKEQQKQSISNDPAEDYAFYKLNNGGSLSLSMHGINYSIENEYAFRYFYTLSDIEDTPDMARDIFKKTELNSFSSANAKKVFEDTLKELEIDNYTMCDYVAFDYETYNRLKPTEKTGEPLPEITIDEEVYCVYASLTVDNIPVVKRAVQTEYNASYQTTLMAIIDKKGNIQNIECGYKFDDLKETSKGNICSYNDALETIKNYYSRIKIEFPITVRSCQLSYMVTQNKNTEEIDSCTLTPVWAFFCQYQQDGQTHTFVKAVDAMKKEVVL